MLPYHFWIRIIAKKGHRANPLGKRDRQLCKPLDKGDRGCTDEKWVLQCLKDWNTGPEWCNCFCLEKRSTSDQPFRPTGHCVDSARLSAAACVAGQDVHNLKQEKFTQGLRKKKFHINTIQQMIFWQPFQVGLSYDTMKRHAHLPPTDSKIRKECPVKTK